LSTSPSPRYDTSHTKAEQTLLDADQDEAVGEPVARLEVEAAVEPEVRSSERRSCTAYQIETVRI